MGSIIVASTRPFAGKTGVCVALVRALAARGVSVGYCKPYGTLPAEIDGVVTDRDAWFVNRHVTPPAAVTDLCPVVRTPAFIEDVLAGRPVPGTTEVLAACARTAEGRDVLVVEGPSDLEQGTAAGLSVCELAELLDAPVLLVEPLDGMVLPDALLAARVCLGQRLRGVVFNRVPDADAGSAAARLSGFLETRGIEVLGAIRRDPLLSSVTVREIVDALDATVLCAEERLDEPVETFMVGAMGQEKALRFFRRKTHKAVITGGDRADVQLAALETSTSVLVLTGDLPPSPIVLARADELGVPMVLTAMDTLGAVERMEAIMGHVRLHGPGKIDRIDELFADGVEWARLAAAFRLPVS